MATGTGSDFVIYQAQAQVGFVETLQQRSDAFNAASNGTIVLRARALEGDYLQEAFFSAISALDTWRDITSTADVDDVPLGQEENVDVKLNRKLGPVGMTRDAWRKIMRNPSEMSFVLGQQAAKATEITRINQVLRSVGAALSGTTDLVHTPSSTMTTGALIDTLSRAGDSATDVILWVMHSTPFFQLMTDQLTNATFDLGAGVTIREGSPATLGRPTLVIDSPALSISGSPAGTYRTLGLKSGAGRATDSELIEMLNDTILGQENIIERWQAEYAFNVGVRGYKWDAGTGGSNPGDGALATAANWASNSVDDKSKAGVMLVTDAA